MGNPEGEDKKEEVAPGGLSKINSNDEQKRHVSL